MRWAWDRLLSAVGMIGASCRWVADLISELVMFLVVSITPGTWRRPPIRREFFRQMRFTAVQATPFVVLVGLIVGATALVRVMGVLRLSGASEEVAPPLLLALLRDPAPVLVNLIILGRSGSAIVTELAGLRESACDRLMTSHGLDLFHFVVVPRVLAMGLAGVGLSIVLNAAALGAALAVNTVFYATSLSDWQLVNAMARTFAWTDGAAFVLRAGLPAVLGGLIGCRIGLAFETSKGGVAQPLPGFFTLSIGMLAVVTLLTTLITL